MAQAENNGTNVVVSLMAGLGGAVALFASIALVVGLTSSNQVTEMLKQFLMATNNIGEHHTLVDYYTHIKGVEYLMAGAFFVAFPLFFKYVNKDMATVKVKK